MTLELAGAIGFVVGVVIVSIVGFILKKNRPENLDAFLDLDWDRDGKSGELYAKLKNKSSSLAEKIKERLN